MSSVTSTLFSFLSLNLSISNFWDANLHTDNLSSKFAINSQFLWKSGTKYMWMPSLVSQDVIILNVSPSGDVHVLGVFWCKNIVLLTIRFLGVAKFSTLTSFLLLFSCKHPLPIICSKISSVPSFAFKSFDRLFLFYLVKGWSAWSDSP